MDEFLDNSKVGLASYETGYEYGETGEPEGMFIKRRPGRPRGSGLKPSSQRGDPEGIFGKRRRGRPRGSGLTPYSQELFESIQGQPVGRGYIRCELCHKIIKETSIYTHRQTHLGIKRFGCEYCGKKFIQKGALMTHRRLHTGEKPYTCSRCRKSFTAHSGLLQHKCPGKQMAVLESDTTNVKLELLNETV